MAIDTSRTGVVIERVGSLWVRRRENVPLGAVLGALEAPGEPLKMSPKSETRCVVRPGRETGGEPVRWVVKTTRGGRPGAALKYALLRKRYRRGWAAGLFLEARGIPVPRPLALVERGRFGLVFGNAVVTEYLETCVNVEAYADRLIGQGASSEVVQAYLARLAESVNRLCASGAWHSDLAGKNILTRDGVTFYFIDLDGIELHRPYTETMRLKNHAQLYDSFIDRWDDARLEPFLARMLPDPSRIRSWMESVRRAQALRRARTEAVWRREGKI